MKVTFVYPDYFETQDIHTEPQGRVYLGIGYLSASLKRAGHEVELVHLIEPTGRSELIELVSRTGPGMVAFSATSLQFSKVRAMSSWVKEELDVPTVCGGVHPTIAPEEALTAPGLDFICVGEGEEALVELCGALEAGGPVEEVGGIWGGSGGEAFRNPARPLVEDLDSLPFPDRGIFDPAMFARNQQKRLTMMASRGCPFNCSYCCNHLQKTIYPNGEHYVRFRSPGNVVAEIEAVRAADPGIEQVRFDDDILTLDRKWFREFAALYAERVGLPFICNARVDLLNEEMVRLMADAGCVTVAMGVESGSAWLRKNVLERGIDDDRIVRAFSLCHRYGITTVSLNMTGFPHETVSMALETVKMNSRIEPGAAQVAALCPFPNTKIYEVCEKGGMLGDAAGDTIFSGHSELELDGMSRRQVNMVCENFVLLMVWYRKLAGLPRPLDRLGTDLLDRFLGSRLVPARVRDRALEKGRYLLDWKYYYGVDY
jgi:radical SAM superfamily enzyme YgiQ (UPF0313 family)